MTEGDTLEEALANAREAIQAYLLSLQDDEQELPAPDGGHLRLRTVEVDLSAA